MNDPMSRTSRGMQKDVQRRLQSLERAIVLRGGGGGGAAPSPLPAKQTLYRNGVTNISATSWADVDSTLFIAIDAPARMRVLVTLGAWMSCTSGDLRLGLSALGATTLTPPDPGWGQVAYLASSDATGTAHRSIQAVLDLEPGTTIFTPKAYRNGSGGTVQVNYPVLEVTPIGWITTPPEMASGALTIPDTGWLPLTNLAPLINGFSAGHQTPEYRIRGGEIFFQGSVYRSTAPGDGSGTPAFIVPEALRPSADQYASTIAFANLSQPTYVHAVTNGEVRIQSATPRTSSPGFALGGLSWPLPATPAGESGPTITDTGWVDISSSLRSDFSGTFLARRVGESIELRGVLSGAVASASVVPIVDAGGIPEVFRPTGSGANRWGTMYANGYVAQIIVRVDGSSAFHHRAGVTTSTNHQFSIAYLR